MKLLQTTVLTTTYNYYPTSNRSSIIDDIAWLKYLSNGNYHAKHFLTTINEYLCDIVTAMIICESLKQR